MLGLPQARRRALAGALAARDHAAFSAMIYAGLRIEETTALAVEDISFVRGEEEVRVARGKGNKERVVPMSPKLRRSLRRYLKVRDELVLVGKSPPPEGVTHLFLNEKGERVTENTLRRRLYSWVRKSAIKKAESKAPRPQAHVWDVVLAGQPRPRQGACRAHGSLRPLPGYEVRPFGRTTRSCGGRQALKARLMATDVLSVLAEPLLGRVF